MRSSNSSKRLRKSRSSNLRAGYQSLEDRKVLAALVSFNVGSGELTVDLTENDDVAVIDVDSGVVTVNGSNDVDSISAGTQTASFSDVLRITVNGDITKANQSVSLNGDYSNAAGATLDTISLDAVNQVNVNGDYQLSDRFDVRLVGSGGSLNDGDTGRLRVGGETDVRANDNAVVLNNADNDFIGPVLVSNSGTNEVVFADANDFNLESVFVSGDFIVNAGGDVTDVPGSNLSVGGIARFTGSSVTLGDNATDVVDLGGFQALTSGDVNLTQDTSVVLTRIDAQNLTINTTEGIFDTRTSDISVTDLAIFNGQNRVRIGENGTDTFNAGSVQFNSIGHVHIWEDSAMNVQGTNTALSLNLYSTGDLTDDDNASINTTMVSGFEAENVFLGDTETDQFNTGSLYFYTPGDFDVSEDSAMQITETKNEARRMFLTSTGAITDALNARVNVELLSQFIATNVNLGDTETDEFNTGSIQFNTTEQFTVNENSSTNFVANNVANSLNVTSAGNITNIYEFEINGATMNVATVAAFTGVNIDLGDQLNDQLNFGAVQFNAPGVVSISEDSGMVLALDSTASSATLNSTGNLADAEEATLNVSGTTQLTAEAIVIGDTETDQFNSELVQLNATGSVSVTEDSSMILTGSNQAAEMTLVANGSIIDTPEAETVVTGNVNLTGTLLNLGNETTDRFESGSLTFNSTGNTNVTSEADIQLVGANSVGDILLLSTTGNLTDVGQARTEVTTRAIFSGVDVIIGDLADDCFDILNGGSANLFVTATGTENVTVACDV